MQPNSPFEERKRGHIRHSLSPKSQATRQTGLEAIHLRHEALPELDFSQVNIQTRGLGPHVLKTPFYVAGMTAGHPDAALINLRIAKACEDRGWAMGVGSQRRQLTDAMAEVTGLAALRVAAPSLFLVGNIGLTQLSALSDDQIYALVDSIHAQALAIHLNALQEVVQLEGTPQFSAGLKTIVRITRLLSRRGVFVVLKETGCGFSTQTLLQIKTATQDAGVELAAIDVSGMGGTHWGKVEGLRAQELNTRMGRIKARVGETFAGWGETTVDSVCAATKIFAGTSTRIWASGGVRTGLDAAKLLALGAHNVGYAKPALEAALVSEDALQEWMELQEYELKTALFCTGCATPDQLRQKEKVWSSSAT